MKNKLEKSNKFTKNKKTSQIDTTNYNNKTVSLSDDKYHPMYDIQTVDKTVFGNIFQELFCLLYVNMYYTV